MKGILRKKEWLGLLCGFCVIGGCFLHTALTQRVETVMFGMVEKTILLDAGHGGWDPGKTGTAGADEKTLNLAIVQKLMGFLEQSGAEVILTRKTDEALGSGKREDMAARKKIVNESEGDLLISIHQNAFPSAKAKGAQVFYHRSSEKGRILAETLQESLRQRVDDGNSRQAKENTDYYILRTTEIPAVIVECGFLSNREEEELLNDETYQERLAWAIYCGILDYFEQTEGLQFSIKSI